MLLSLIVFILLLSVLVFVHELGHFLMAKWTGMRVDEFNIGFPPRLYSKRVGDTLYSVNWILLGGYVKIHGEDPSAQADPDTRSYANKPVWARILVIISGVGMNLLFAFLVLTIAFSVGFVSGSQDLAAVPGAVVKESQVYVVSELPHSPISTTPVQPGDVITGIADQSGSNPIPVDTVEGLQNALSTYLQKGDRNVTILYTHNQASYQAKVRLNPTGPALGVAIDNFNTVRVPVWRAPGVAAKEIGSLSTATWNALKNFADQLFIHAKLDHSVSGPVGVYRAADAATKEGWPAVIYLGVVLSISLAVFNILPVPALDGGRLVFLLTELIFRKRIIAEQLEGWLHMVGFAALMLLILLITISDVRGLI